jgi:hypothetical protein
VAEAFEVVSFMSLTWPAILAVAVSWVVRDRISLNKALRQAAADTAEMREAAKIHAESERETQRAIRGVKLWFYKKLPGGELHKTEVRTLRPIEPPKAEDPAT